MERLKSVNELRKRRIMRKYKEIEEKRKGEKEE